MGKTRIFLLFLLSIIVILIIIALGFLIKNTAFLNPNQSQEEISQNNNSTNTPDIDLSTLTSKTLEVPEQFNKGVFGTTRKVNLPENFNISVYDTGLKKLRFMDFTENNDIVVTDIGAGKVYLVKDTNNDNIADQNIEIDSGFTNVHGIDYYKGNLYVGEETKVLLYKDLDSSGKYSSKEVIINNLPSPGQHNTRTVQVGPDEKLYVSIGSSCNVCDESDPRRAGIIRSNLDGSNQEVFASGLRNTVGFIFDDNGKIWGVDNGRDELGDNLPPEEVNIIEQGKNYGWPNCYGDRINNPEYQKDKDYCIKSTTGPLYQLQAHSAPLGLTFVPKANNFPEQMEKDLFIVFHGSWNRTTRTGYKVVRLDTTSLESQAVNFITGWLDDNGSFWGRPVDAKFDKNGDLFITDDENGSIYKVTYNSNF